jgi:hypothetical protein
VYNTISLRRIPMGLLDKLKTKATEAIKDPETQKKIKKLAEEKGITAESVKNKLLKKDKK